MTQRERDLKRATANRQFIAQYKLDKGCIDCGYNKDARALEFDHIHNDGKPHSGKQRTVASMMYFSMKKIMEEVSKCEVVCCNCHAIRTHERRN
jgi:hypothetical protein